jgi:predicted MPP superfamily phosphohydrolase
MSRPLVHRLREAWRFARGLSKGLARGDFCPAGGRPAPQAAPGGSARRRLGAGRGVSGYIEHRHVLPVPGLGAPFELLHLSDLHVRGCGPWLDGLCATLRAVPPADVVVITGDLVGRGWQPDAVDQLLAALPAGRHGRYAILGNWEHWTGATGPAWAARLRAAGVTLLVDAAVDLGPVRLAGTDDALAGNPDFDALLRPLAGPVVVLTHSPDCMAALARPAVPLVLAGHTHAGQVRLPGLGALWVPKGTGPHVHGWSRVGPTWLSVSAGLGWSVGPVRIGVPPEIARVRLEPAAVP